MHSRSYVSFVTTQLTRQRTSKMRQFMGYRVLVCSSALPDNQRPTTWAILMLRAFGLFCLLLLAACSSKTDQPSDRTQAAIHFQEGEAAFASGLYQDAIAAWEKVRESYYSPELNTLVDLKIAEAHFLAGNYVEAAVAFEQFLKTHRNHPRAADALYQLGIAYHNQTRSHDQDQTPTRLALQAFRDFQNRFPDDPRHQEVAGYIAMERDKLAAHELYVARFYLKADHYEAAIGRLKGLLDNFPDYRNKAEVYLYLGQAYLEDHERAKAIETFNILFEKYPLSEYTEEAREFVDENF